MDILISIEKDGAIQIRKTNSRRKTVTVTIEAVQAGIIDTRAVILTANQETARTIFVEHEKDRQHSGDYL